MMHELSEEEIEANAQLIVKAVNSHEKLIEALKSAVDTLEGFGCEEVPYYDKILKEVE